MDDKQKTSMMIYKKDVDFLWDMKRKLNLDNLADALNIVTNFYKEKKK